MKTTIFILILLTVINLVSQVDSAKTFILPKLEIYQYKGDKIESYAFIEHDENKFFLQKELLKADTVKYLYSVPIEKINRVSFRNGSMGWKFAGISGAFGFAAGFYIFRHRIDFGGSSSEGFHFPSAMVGGALVGIPFALIGGLVGLLIPDYDNYDLYKVEKEKKYKYLKKVFNKYKINSF